MTDSNDPRLTAYVLGELDDAERVALESELQGSAELQAEVQAIHEATDLLAEHLPAADCPSLTDTERAEVFESGREDSEAGDAFSEPKARRRTRFLAASLAIAASLLVACLITASRVRWFPVAQQDPEPSLTVLMDDVAREPDEIEKLGDILSQDDDVPMAFDDQQGGFSYGASGSEMYGSAPMPADVSEVEADFDVDAFGTDIPQFGGFDAGSGRSRRQIVQSYGGRLQSQNGQAASDHGSVIDPRYDLRRASTWRMPIVGREGREGRETEAVTELSVTTAPESPPAADSDGRDVAGTVQDASGNSAQAPDQAENGEGRSLGRREDESNSGDSPNEGKEGRSRRPNRTWRRATASPNASRLLVGDHDELPLEGMQVHVTVDGFRARVLLDLYYFNDFDRQLEGNFRLRLPNEASLYYFAFGQSAFEYRPQVDQLASAGFLTADLIRAAGTAPHQIREARSGSWQNVKEARMVPRVKAAHAYSETVRRRVDPALVEWSGAGIFQARVFPLLPKKLHRIVVGYDVTLQSDGNDLLYSLNLPEDLSQTRVDLDVSALPGLTAEVTPSSRPFVSAGRAFYHFDDPADKQIQVRLSDPGTLMLAGSQDEANYFSAQIALDLPGGEVTEAADHAIFLLDTSLSSNPDKFNVWQSLLEHVLEGNRDSIHRFAVLFFNVETRWWQPRYVENTPENVQAVLNAVAQRSLEGATDVHAALVEATSPAWRKRNAQPLKADLFLLSDGAATWGQRDVNRMIQTVEAGKSGALFAYQTGLTGTAVGMLERLAQGTGGAVFSVVGEKDIEGAATAHRQRPWRLLNVAADGASDLLVAGRPQYVYADQTLLIAGRGTPQGAFHLHLRRGEEDQRVTVVVDQTVESELAARTYGQVAVGQLEDLADATEEVAVAYARHFRVTGRTCSLLMLESEADYERFGIGTNDDSVVIDTSPAENLIRRTADEMAQRLTDPKAALQARLARLEKTPGLSFELPTALRLLIDRLPAEAFEISASRLACECETWKQLPKKFSARLTSGDIDYETVVAEAERRRESFGTHDALKALSNLVEVDAGEIGVTMDVAFSAMAWGEAGSAYWLLDRVSAARPYLPSVYLAMADCLEQMERPELAMVYYEVAMAADWHDRYREIHNIALLHYTRFLQQQTTNDPSSPAKDYLAARLRSLRRAGMAEKVDLVVTMLWNTDRTDVDLHVLEPSGEECFYDHARTRAGGRITPDVTEGYGPEMYTIGDAPAGPYRVSAVYYRTDANRTTSRSRAFVTILQHPGTDQQQITRYAVLLDDHQDTHEIATVKIAN